MDNVQDIQTEQLNDQQTEPQTDEIIVSNQPKPFFEHPMDIRPIRLKHIKNNLMLDNSFNPLNNKYVKKIWVYKTTKMDRIKRDMFWEYFRDRKRHNIPETLLKAYYKNRKDATIIYFDDPVQYEFTITDEIAEELKGYNRKIVAFKKEMAPPKIKKEKKEKKVKVKKEYKKTHYKVSKDNKDKQNK